MVVELVLAMWTALWFGGCRVGVISGILGFDLVGVLGRDWFGNERLL
jgi:hypothetical protein